MLWLHRLDSDNRSDLNGNNRSYNNRSLANDNTVRGMALSRGFIMKTHKSIYAEIISLDNLVLAWQKARKKRTQKDYVMEFEKNIFANLKKLHLELKDHTYNPKPLITFILRDPKD